MHKICYIYLIFCIIVIFNFLNLLLVDELTQPIPLNKDFIIFTFTGQNISQEKAGDTITEDAGGEE